MGKDKFRDKLKKIGDHIKLQSLGTIVIHLAIESFIQQIFPEQLRNGPSADLLAPSNIARRKVKSWLSWVCISLVF